MNDLYSYPAIFDFAEDGVNVSFPDLKGCFTCGNTFEEALSMAKDVLEGWLYLVEQDHSPIPEPTDLNNIAIKEGQRLELIEVDMRSVRQEKIVIKYKD